VSTEAEYISRIIVEGDSEAFGELVKKYQGPIRALFRKLTCGDDSWADDLAQETFFKAYRGIRGYQGQAQFLTWLYSIAKNVFYQSLRDNPKTEELNEVEEGEDSKYDTNMDVAKLLRILDEKERMVLSLSYAEGMSHSEVAEMMDMPIGTVKTLILRAKEKIHKKLSLVKEQSV
jgi:RNA polymerase sigma-70 factor (ECF subfamily)